MCICPLTRLDIDAPIPDRLLKLARPSRTAATLQDVVKDVDAIIFSMHFNAYKDLPENLWEEVAQDVVIMDTSNYYPFRDGEIAELEHISESVYISGILNRPLVKVFNNILEYTLKPKVQNSRCGRKDSDFYSRR